MKKPRFVQVLLSVEQKWRIIDHMGKQIHLLLFICHVTIINYEGEKCFLSYYVLWLSAVS